MISSTSWKALLIAIVVTLGGFVFGIDAAVISGAVPYLVTKFGLTDIQVGMAVSAPGLGAVLALLFTGYVCDKFGRKPALILVAGLYAVSGIWATFATGYYTLVVARFLGGLAFASLSIASMYLGEIAPPNWRGKLVSLNQTSIVLGFTVSYFINYAILQLSHSDASWVRAWAVDTETWRWMLGTLIPPAVAWFFLVLLVPESPRWLMLKGRAEEARKVMGKVLQSKEVELEMKEVAESLHKTDGGRSMSAQLSELFTPRRRLVMLVGLTIAAVQPATGINSVLFYGPTVFEQLGIGTDAAFIQSVFVGVVSTVFTILAIFLVDKIGRRKILLWGLAWCALSLGICAYGFKTARYELTSAAVVKLDASINKEALKPVVDVMYRSDIEFRKALNQAIGEQQTRIHYSTLLQRAAVMPAGLILFGIFSFMAAFQFSVGPIMWVLFSEIFPISIRGVAIPACAFVTTIVNYIVTQFFPWELATFGAATTWMIYAVISVAGMVVLYRWLPETKNKTIEEVELAFEEAGKKGRV